jgi:class 3 adenylate cyclase
MEGSALRAGELVYGLVVAVDIVGFSKLDILGQAASQTLLERLLDDATAAVGLARGHWRYRQPRGDGELAVLPADTDVALVVSDWVHAIVEALRELRSASGPALRIRVAMHHGPLSAGRFGPVGSGPIVACRLLDARQARAALAADPQCDLVLVVSRQLYEDVVAARFRGLAAERFRPTHTRIKGRTYFGYLCLGTPKRVSTPVRGTHVVTRAPVR